MTTNLEAVQNATIGLLVLLLVIILGLIYGSSPKQVPTEASMERICSLKRDDMIVETSNGIVAVHIVVRDAEQPCMLRHLTTLNYGEKTRYTASDWAADLDKSPESILIIPAGEQAEFAKHVLAFKPITVKKE